MFGDGGGNIGELSRFRWHTFQAIPMSKLRLYTHASDADEDETRRGEKRCSIFSPCSILHIPLRKKYTHLHRISSIIERTQNNVNTLLQALAKKSRAEKPEGLVVRFFSPSIFFCDRRKYMIKKRVGGRRD